MSVYALNVVPQESPPPKRSTVYALNEQPQERNANRPRSGALKNVPLDRVVCAGIAATPDTETRESAAEHKDSADAVAHRRLAKNTAVRVSTAR